MIQNKIKKPLTIFFLILMACLTLTLNLNVMPSSTYTSPFEEEKSTLSSVMKRSAIHEDDNIVSPVKKEQRTFQAINPLQKGLFLNYTYNYNGTRIDYLTINIFDENDSFLYVRYENTTTGALPPNPQTIYVKKNAHNHVFDVHPYLLEIDNEQENITYYQFPYWFDISNINVGTKFDPINYLYNSSSGSIPGEYNFTVQTTNVELTLDGKNYTTIFANASIKILSYTFEYKIWIDQESGIVVKSSSDSFNVHTELALNFASYREPPKITNVDVIPENDSALITWKTDDYSNSTVFYGLEKNNLNMTATNDSYVQDHEVLLTGLTPNTTYYFKVKSVDQFGNAKIEDNNGLLYNFTTLLHVLKITNMNIEVTNQSASIYWETLEKTNVTVWYGESETNLSLSVQNKIFSTTHNISLTNLKEFTRYYFTIESYDENGVFLEAKNGTRPFTFRTADYTPPKITTLDYKVSNDTLFLTIKTNEPVNLSILYGKTANNLNNELTIGDFNTTHLVTLSNLDSYTVYYFRVKVYDQSGNARISPSPTQPPWNFTTEDYLPPIISHPLDLFLKIGEKGTISWNISDSLPAYYLIIVQNEVQLNRSWDTSPYIVNYTFTATTAGVFEVKIIAFDEHNRSSEDIVVILVEKAQKGSTLIPWKFDLGFLFASIVLYGIVYRQRRKIKKRF